MELKITDSNFEAEVKESSLPVLVDFFVGLSAYLLFLIFCVGFRRAEEQQ